MNLCITIKKKGSSGGWMSLEKALQKQGRINQKLQREYLFKNTTPIY